MTDRESVDPDEVRHVAELARINLDAEAIESYTADFDEILAYFETLEDVPETEQELELSNVLRSDDIEESLDREAVLRNAPESEDGFIKGPRVS